MPLVNRSPTQFLRIERAGSATTKALENQRTVPFDLDHLSQALKEGEKVIFSKLQEEVASIYATLGFSRVGDHRFLVDAHENFLELCVARDAVRRDTVIVTALLMPATADDEPNPTQRSRQLKALGRYRKIEVFASKRLDAAIDLVADVAVSVLQAGCRWLAERIVDAASSADVALTNELYRQLHVIVPEPELQRNLWFAMIGPRLGFRLLDASVIWPAFDLVDESAAKFHLDTLELVAELVRTRLPRVGLLMNEALASDQPREMHFSDADYSKVGSIYTVALRALYGSDSLYIMPVMRSPRRSVLLLFPHIANLCDRLTERRKELVEICERSEQEITSALERFEAETEWDSRALSHDEIDPSTVKVLAKRNLISSAATKLFRGRRLAEELRSAANDLQ